MTCERCLRRIAWGDLSHHVPGGGRRHADCAAVRPKQMLCTYCCTMREYPDDFPNALYAHCRYCYAREAAERNKPGLWARFCAWVKARLA